MRTTSAAPVATRYVPALTGLRAVAAYLVFLHHYNPAPPGTFTHALFDQGYIGVAVFFVLSGLLIYHRYADAYLKGKNWSWQTYLQNRFARIFPLYALILSITVGYSFVAGHPTGWRLLGLNLTLGKGFFDDYKFSGIAQSWSLTVEECFYLSAPFLFVALQRWSASRLTACLVSIGLLMWSTVGPWVGHGFFGSLPFTLFYTFFGRFFEFVVGMWLARRWHRLRLPSVRYATVGGLGWLSGCVLWQAYSQTLTLEADGLFWSEAIVYNYLLPIGIGVFFLGLLREKTAIQYWLSHPAMQALGRGSYAFYLIHIGLIANGLQKLGVTNHGLLFGLLVLIAQGLCHFVEKPMNRWLRATNPSTP